MEYKLCYDDISLVPMYSELSSRLDPNTRVNLGGIQLESPIVSAPMDSITGKRMLLAMDQSGGLGILSRYITMDEQEEVQQQVAKIKWAKENGAVNVGCAMGIKKDVRRNAATLLEAGCNVICIDMFIGDREHIHKGLGKDIVRQFLKEKVFIDDAVSTCIAGPAPSDISTIRMYEKAGFDYLKTIQCKDQKDPENIMMVKKSLYLKLET